MGHVDVGHRWERVAMDLLDMSVTTARGNIYVLVMVDCFTRWTEAFPLPGNPWQMRSLIRSFVGLECRV